MTRYIIRHRLTSVEQLKAFDTDGYFYDEAASSADELVFKRHEQ